MRTPALAAALAAGLAVAACTASTPAAAPVPTVVTWGDCASVAGVPGDRIPAERRAGVELTCGTLGVPLDPADADAGTIGLQLVRVHRTGAAAHEPLLLIAGGPGQSGVDLASDAVSLLPAELLDRYDLVGFDPRGVARSQPIRCARGEEQRPTFPDLLTDAGYAASAALMRTYSEECSQALGASAAHYSTTATAADIDLIRTALGQSALTYIGWSYGAKLGAEYARQFPQHVRAAVLDAPSNPTTTWIETAERQVAGFEDSFDQFVAWCTSTGSCAALGDVRAFVGDLARRAQSTPIPSGRPGDVVPTNGVEVLDAVVAALYDDVRWPDLAAGLAEADDGDSGTLRNLIDSVRSDSGDSNESDAQFVINCNDAAPGPVEAEIKAAGKRFAEQFPLFGVWGSWQLFGCAFWTPTRHTLKPPVAATTTPIVVVGTVHDPATPYPGAVALADSLGDARLLTWEGTGHGAVGRSECVTSLVTAYLLELEVPRTGTRCPA